MHEQGSVKVVLLGESGVGKTNIINQFTTKKFNPRCPTSCKCTIYIKNNRFTPFLKINKI